MGYNTAFLILNDAANQLLKDPDVGRKMHEAMLSSSLPEYAVKGVGFSIGNHSNGGMVLPSRHADDVQLIAVGYNYMRRLADVYHVDITDSVEVCKRLADALGYRLVKKPSGRR